MHTPLLTHGIDVPLRATQADALSAVRNDSLLGRWVNVALASLLIFPFVYADRIGSERNERAHEAPRGPRSATTDTFIPSQYRWFAETVRQTTSNRLQYSV